MRLFRLLKILSVVIRFGLDEFLPAGFWRSFIRGAFFWRRFNQPRAVRLRLALEGLGPLFVKFGQLLSTRPDLVPEDIAHELAHLQDSVPPFASEAVVARLDAAYDARITKFFQPLISRLSPAPPLHKSISPPLAKANSLAGKLR
jgi:ubiquinone biosynthesis protein